MKFLKFPSIRQLNSYLKNKIGELDIRNDLWQVTEKVHGCNVAVYCDGENVKFASRIEFVDNIYNLKNTFEPHRELFVNMVDHWCQQMKKSGIQGAYFVTYMELFGGSVQKGMPYPSQQDLVLLDVVTVVPNTGNNLEICRGIFEKAGVSPDRCIVLEDEGLFYMNSYDKMDALKNISDYTGIKNQRILKLGTFEECAAMSPEFETLYRSEQKLIDSGVIKQSAEMLEHFCKSEGYVIEPVIPMVDNNGERVMYKVKSKKFQEKGKDKVDKSEPNLRERHKLALDEMEADLLTEMDQMITKPRYESVVSKLGEVTVKDFNKVLVEFMEDIKKDTDEFLVDIILDGGDEADRFNGATKLVMFEHHKEMLNLLQGEVKNFIRPLLLNN